MGGDAQPAGTGINGTGGAQPRFTTISGNIIHEVSCLLATRSPPFESETSCPMTALHGGGAFGSLTRSFK